MPYVRLTEPWPLGSPEGSRDGELVVQPPEWDRPPGAVCGDCGLDDNLVPYARLCQWCADLRRLLHKPVRGGRR